MIGFHDALYTTKFHVNTAPSTAYEGTFGTVIQILGPILAHIVHAP